MGLIAQNPGDMNQPFRLNFPNSNTQGVALGFYEMHLRCVKGSKQAGASGVETSGKCPNHIASFARSLRIAASQVFQTAQRLAVTPLIAPCLASKSMRNAG